MKINGKRPGVFEEPVVIPRADENFVFICKAIMDFTEFEKVCAAPKGKTRSYPDGRVEEDVSSPEYKAAVEAYAEKKGQWMFLKSIEDTPGLEWDKVKLGEPETWQHATDELKEAGFSGNELGQINRGILIANSLHEGVLEKARESFLASARSTNDQ